MERDTAVCGGCFPGETGSPLLDQPSVSLIN